MTGNNIFLVMNYFFQYLYFVVVVVNIARSVVFNAMFEHEMEERKQVCNRLFSSVSSIIIFLD